MEFFGMGTGEILVILVIALIVFGPDRLVGVARTLGRVVHNVTKAGKDFTRQVEAELDLDQPAKKGTVPPEKPGTSKPDVQTPGRT
ncbi:MAG: twin-arginine translocase TatA/TatE family subunit [Chloroflexi bacterium]|nr:twin-arginine translocase TatA/TatE family subunit [Chloroflexota bacterium]